MPLSYRIDRAARLIHVKGSGRMTVSEMETVAAAIVHDPLFEKGLDVMSDMRELTTAPSTDDARHASLVIEQLSAAGLGRIATVAVAASTYGMVQLIGNLATRFGAEAEVFNTPEEALAWLAEAPSERKKPIRRRRT